MNSLLERLRKALAPDYEVVGELASGGMGVVFLGRDVNLNRRVAIKIIRPDRVTPRAAERFIREARLLAAVSHPGVIPVHRAGSAGGFAYYVMDFVESRTLADKLAAGRLTLPDAVRVGAELLEALAAVHAVGIVHRDIKPANLFDTASGVLLVDFGLAKIPDEPGLTTPQSPVGTLAYMSPEQLAGAEVTTATDLYASGAVIYESLTGRLWPHAADPNRADWTGVPRRLAKVLKRALSTSPEKRWPDAGSFRTAFLEAARKPKGLPALPGVVAALAAGALLLPALWPGAAAPGPPSLRINAFAVTGDVPSRGLGDSLAAALARSLGANPDFSVQGPGAPQGGRNELLLGGLVEASRDSITVTVHTEAGGSSVVFARASGPAASLASLADTLARGVLTGLWSRDQGLSGLPLATLPRSAAGTAAFVAAERLYSGARWIEAYQAYSRALASDPTCVICAWRIYDVERWLGLEHDTARTTLYRLRVDSFPPAYRSLIRASVTRAPARFDTLRAAAERHRGFAMAWFNLGDELLHRGPLSGMPRSEALYALRQATIIRPDFAPAWEHLAWAAIAEGDSATAHLAVARHRATSAAVDTLAFLLGKLFDVAATFRFQSREDAARRSGPVLADPLVAASPMLGVAPRMLMSFEVPEGALWMGEQFSSLASRPDALRSGHIARVVALLALGRPARALAAAEDLALREPDPETRLFPAELRAAWLLLAEPDRLAAALEEVRRDLEPFRAAHQPAAVRRRAAFMQALAAYEAGRADLARGAVPVLAGEPAPRPLLALVEAAGAAAGRGGEGARRALALTEGLLLLDSAARAEDPFYRTLLHFMRARWRLVLGQPEPAVRELRWHENLDLVRYPAGAIQAAEVDWAFGTAARWLRGRLLAEQGRRDLETCSTLLAVARRWSGAEDRWAQAADSARALLGRAGCAGRA